MCCRNAEPESFVRRWPHITTLIPFYDVGYAANHDHDAGERLDSAGVGFLVNPNRHVSFALYYGIPFRNLDKSHHDLQDYGIHFSLLFRAF